MLTAKHLLYFLSLILIFALGCKDDDPKPFKQRVELKINHTWNDSLLILNKAYSWTQGLRNDTIIPTKLIYHINNLRLLTEDSQEIAANLPYYMINYEDQAVLPENISFTTPKEGVKYYVNAIEFTIGVADSLTNLNDLLGSTFVTRMYWGMVQGYINFKFEALSPSPNVSAIIYHIGGYTAPYYNSRRVRVSFDKPYLLNENNTLTITADLFKLFDSANLIDIEKTSDVQIPNDDSKLIADNMAKLFSFGKFQ